MSKEEKEKLGELADRLSAVAKELAALGCELSVKIKFDDGESISATYQSDKVPDQGEMQ